MSERQLEALREDAERVLRVPDFAIIEAAGRRRRRRRRAVASTAAACVLAVTGFVVLRDDAPQPPGPGQERDPKSLATPWPGPLMRTLPAGIYEFDPSGSLIGPAVRLTLPRGWNAWQGPNRFDGMGPGVIDNEQVLTSGVSSWYAGVLVVELYRVTQPDCSRQEVSGGGAVPIVEALEEHPRFEVIREPEGTVRFGHPVVHLRLRAKGGTGGCLESLFDTERYADISYGEKDERFDVWVYDVDGRPIVVWASWSPTTPARIVDQLLAIAESTELSE